MNPAEKYGSMVSMSELWICREQIAEKPFRLETEGMEIRTIEELCFFLYHAIERLEEDCFSEALLLWIEWELKMPRLACSLREEKQQGKNPIWCAWFLLKEIGLYSEEELGEIKNLCFAMDNKDAFECQKLKADRLLQGKRYLRSIRQYEQLLQIGEENRKYQGLLGDIRHNLGVAYAGLFLYTEAAEYFKAAYEQNRRIESKEAYEEVLKLLSPMDTNEQWDFMENPNWEDVLYELREDYKKKVM